MALFHLAQRREFSSLTRPHSVCGPVRLRGRDIREIGGYAKTLTQPKMDRFQYSAFAAKNHRPLDHILQLADITRPVMFLQGGIAGRGNSMDLHPVLARKPLPKLL